MTKASALGEDRTHDLQIAQYVVLWIMRLTRCLLRYESHWLELLKILSFICIGSGRLLCHRPAGWCGRLSNMNTFGECAALQVDYTFRETNLVGRSQATPEATLVTIQHQYNCLIW